MHGADCLRVVLRTRIDTGIHRNSGGGQASQRTLFLWTPPRKEQCSDVTEKRRWSGGSICVAEREENVEDTTDGHYDAPLHCNHLYHLLFLLSTILPKIL